MSLSERLQNWERRRRAADKERVFANFSIARAERHVRIYDHGFLRRFWSNFDEIAPGVFRSNYPNGRRFPGLKAKGIKAIISLRGERGSVNYRLEETLCDQYGIAFHSINLNARKAPEKAELLHLLNLFDTIERPFLMHCKSGADRAGLASALYLLHSEGKPLTEAREMLSLRYLHLNNRKTGIMGHVLTEYERQGLPAGLSVRDWITQSYDPVEVQSNFRVARKK